MALGGLLTLGLTACGAAGAAANPGATATATIHGPRVTTALPCTGNYTTSPTPALVLSNQGAVSGSAHVGDVIQIVMDGGHIWTFIPAAGSAMAEIQAGMFDRATGDCVWRFRATTPGSDLLKFSGVQNCPRDQICPDYVILVTFSVRIT
jgi:hypothetical protein